MGARRQKRKVCVSASVASGHMFESYFLFLGSDNWDSEMKSLLIIAFILAALFSNKLISHKPTIAC